MEKMLQLRMHEVWHFLLPASWNPEASLWEAHATWRLSLDSSSWPGNGQGNFPACEGVKSSDNTAPVAIVGSRRPHRSLHSIARENMVVVNMHQRALSSFSEQQELLCIGRMLCDIGTVTLTVLSSHFSICPMKKKNLPISHIGCDFMGQWRRVPYLVPGIC